MSKEQEVKHTPTTFHEWVKHTFTWVDNDVKRYMQRAWTASTKAANKRNTQETTALKKENEELRATVGEMGQILKDELKRLNYAIDAMPDNELGKQVFVDDYVKLTNVLTKAGITV